MQLGRCCGCGVRRFPLGLAIDPKERYNRIYVGGSAVQDTMGYSLGAVEGRMLGRLAKVFPISK